MPRVFVSIGSNVEPERHVRFAVRALRERFGELDVSPVYRTAAVGFDGDDFLNLAVGFHTDESIESVDAALDAIESSAGRYRSGVGNGGNGARFAPRTLDLDLMLFGDAVMDTTVDARRIRVPRKEITEYAFMLRPLADIAGDFPHPGLAQTIGELLSSRNLAEQRCERIDFDADSMSGREKIPGEQ